MFGDNEKKDNLDFEKKVNISCPFCGNNELGIGRGTEDREGFPVYVYCGECGAQGPWIYTRDENVLRRIEIACDKTGWNKRFNVCDKDE